MRVREPAALRREPIQVRRLRVLRAVAREVRIADVVGEEEDDVRPVGGVRCESGEEKGDEEVREGFHGAKQTSRRENAELERVGNLFDAGDAHLSRATLAPMHKTGHPPRMKFDLMFSIIDMMRDRLHAAPFQPFVVGLHSGEKLRVKNPDVLTVTLSGWVIYDDGTKARMLNPALVAEIETKSAKG